MIFMMDNNFIDKPGFIFIIFIEAVNVAKNNQNSTGMHNRLVTATELKHYNDS